MLSRLSRYPIPQVYEEKLMDELRQAQILLQQQYLLQKSLQQFLILAIIAKRKKGNSNSTLLKLPIEILKLIGKNIAMEVGVSHQQIEQFCNQFSRKLSLLKRKKRRISANSSQQLGWNSFDLAIELAKTLNIQHVSGETTAISARGKLVQYALFQSNNVNFRRLVAPEIRYASALTVTYMLIHEAEDEAEVTKAYQLAKLFKIHHVLKLIETEQNIKRQLPKGLLPESLHSSEMKDKVIQYLAAHESMNRAVEDCNKSLGRPEGLHLSLLELDHFFSHSQAQSTHLDIYQKFRTSRNELFTPSEVIFHNFCDSEETYRLYIKSYCDNLDESGHTGWFTIPSRFSREKNTSMIDIVALMLQKQIIIHCLTEDNILYQTQIQFDKKIHILYDENNHFTVHPIFREHSSLLNMLKREFSLWKLASRQTVNNALPEAGSTIDQENANQTWPLS